MRSRGVTGKPTGARGYATDLAYIHDAGFGDFARRAAPGLLAMFERAGITRGRVVDLGCGSGIWARALDRAGHRVTGIDASASMLALARRRAPGAVFVHGSYLEIELPPCDAVTSLGECLNYRFDVRVGARSLATLFRRVFAALSPGGLFVFDLAGPGRVPAGRGGNHRQGADWAIMTEAREDPGRRELVRRITTFRRVGRVYRRGFETHRLRLHEPAAVAAMLRRRGFRVRFLRGYGELRFRKGHTGFLARKPR